LAQFHDLAFAIDAYRKDGTSLPGIDHCMRHYQHADFRTELSDDNPSNSRLKTVARICNNTPAPNGKAGQAPMKYRPLMPRA
jgi:hypothetical protein